MPWHCPTCCPHPLFFPKKEGCGSNPRRQNELGIAAGAGPRRPSPAGLRCQMGSLCNSPHGCCLQPVPTSRIPPGPAALDHDPLIAPCITTVLPCTPIPDRSPQALEGPQCYFWGSGATRHSDCRCPTGGRDKEPSWVLAALLGKPSPATPACPPCPPRSWRGHTDREERGKEPNAPTQQRGPHGGTGSGHSQPEGGSEGSVTAGAGPAVPAQPPAQRCSPRR